MDFRRPLTIAETALARSVFDDAIDYARVTVRRSKWAFFQPRETVMAPMGHIHFHPQGTRYRDDFGIAAPGDQALFIHEMVHVWQHQQGIFLPIARHPFCSYAYTLEPGRPFERYGIEQQAEIVAHAFLLRRDVRVAGAPPLEELERLIPFTGG